MIGAVYCKKPGATFRQLCQNTTINARIDTGSISSCRDDLVSVASGFQLNCSSFLIDNAVNALFHRVSINSTIVAHLQQGHHKIARDAVSLDSDHDEFFFCTRFSCLRAIGKERKEMLACNDCGAFFANGCSNAVNIFTGSFVAISSFDEHNTVLTLAFDKDFKLLEGHGWI